jgi:hypothetical protein
MWQAAVALKEPGENKIPIKSIYYDFTSLTSHP